jgi:hypothetical protein
LFFWDLALQTICLGWLWTTILLSVRNERGMEEAEGQLKHQHRVYCSDRSPVEGDPSKTARAHCHTQSWARYRRLVEKYLKGWTTKKDKLWLGHCLLNSPWHPPRDKD